MISSVSAYFAFLAQFEKEMDWVECLLKFRILLFSTDNLKDLLRFLRRDDPQNRDVFKEVCKWNILSKDLIPIIEHCQEDRSLVLNAGKFL